MIVVITGASGFIGREVARSASQRGWQVRQVAHIRSPDPEAGEIYRIEDVTRQEEWCGVLAGADAIVHLAACAHVPRAKSVSSAEYRRVNATGTAAVARAAAELGVKRLVFVSSIGVHGPTDAGVPVTEASQVRPGTPYATSKWEAEQALVATQVEHVIVRPPLVYGPDAPGNLRALLRWVNRGLPLPREFAKSVRSLIALDNLTDFVLTALSHPRAANQTFVVADREALPVDQLAARLALRPVRLVGIPVGWLRSPLRWLGLPEAYFHLGDSLRIDIAKARALLAWEPPLSLDAGLDKLRRWHHGAALPS